MSQEACSSVSRLTVVLFPDTLSSAPSTTAALKTPDLQCSNPSASLAETEVTRKNNEGNPEVPELADVGDIQIEYSFNYLCNPNIGSAIKLICQNLGQCRFCLITWNIG